MKINLHGMTSLECIKWCTLYIIDIIFALNTYLLTYLINWSLVKSWMVRRSVWFGFGFNNLSDIYVPMCCAESTGISATIFVIHTIYHSWFQTKTTQFQNKKTSRITAELIRDRSIFSSKFPMHNDVHFRVL